MSNTLHVQTLIRGIPSFQQWLYVSAATSFIHELSTDRNTGRQADRHTHTYTHTHTNKHTHTHTHTLTHTHSVTTERAAVE